MKVLDAKIIDTQYGLETYLDLLNNIKVTDLHIPTVESPFFDIKLGIEYFRLRDEKYYNSEIRYFWIRIHPDLNSITLLESEIQNLFGVKDKDEREATKELIGEWLINTHAFKHSITEIINQKKANNVLTEEEIRKTLQTIELLERMLEIKTEDILNAPVEKYS